LSEDNLLLFSTALPKKIPFLFLIQSCLLSQLIHSIRHKIHKINTAARSREGGEGRDGKKDKALEV
jgi:hypothetical protein